MKFPYHKAKTREEFNALSKQERIKAILDNRAFSSDCIREEDMEFFIRTYPEIFKIEPPENLHLSFYVDNETKEFGLCFMCFGADKETIFLPTEEMSDLALWLLYEMPTGNYLRRILRENGIKYKKLLPPTYNFNNSPFPLI